MYTYMYNVLIYIQKIIIKVFGENHKYLRIKYTPKNLMYL